MSFRLTLGTVRGMCARVLDLPPNDSRVAEYINRAQELLLIEGSWVQSLAEYRICIKDSCITWPREIESIYQWAFCDWPGEIRSQWHHFSGFGYGITDPTRCNGNTLIDAGEGCAFDSPDGGALKRYAVYPHGDESTTAYIVVQGYDNSGQWVRTVGSSGSMIDGEEIPIAPKGVYRYGTKNIAKAGLVRVIKPVTNSPVYLFEHDAITGIYKALAQYQPGETLPVYRRSVVPGLSTYAAGQGDTCESVAVTVLAALRHIPVVNDNDFLIIPLADALSLEVQAIRKRENNLMVEATAHHLQAVDLLGKHLKRHRGPAMQEPIRMAPAAVYGGAIDCVM